MFLIVMFVKLVMNLGNLFNKNIKTNIFIVIYS